MNTPHMSGILNSQHRVHVVLNSQHRVHLVLSSQHRVHVYGVHVVLNNCHKIITTTAQNKTDGAKIY